MPRKGQILPSPCRVAVLVPDGARLIGLIGCLDAFDAANRVLAHANKPPIYTLSTLGLTTRVRSESGTVLATQRARELARVDTLIVGGSLAHIESPFRPRYLAEVSRLAQTARRVVSVCTGSFALGQLGLLAIEVGLQAFGLGLLLGQCGTGTGKQLLLLATITNEGLLAGLHGADLGGTVAANALEQLVGTERLRRMRGERQQRDKEQGKQTAHCAASSARVFTGNCR